MSKITDFIEDFKKFGTGKEIEDCFSYGYCYWFAVILEKRFPCGVICYSEVDNHFMYSNFDRLYDITGDCTEKYPDAIAWKKYELKEVGSTHFDNIIRNCILKERE